MTSFVFSLVLGLLVKLRNVKVRPSPPSYLFTKLWTVNLTDIRHASMHVNKIERVSQTRCKVGSERFIDLTWRLHGGGLLDLSDIAVA